MSLDVSDVSGCLGMSFVGFQFAKMTSLHDIIWYVIWPHVLYTRKGIATCHVGAEAHRLEQVQTHWVLDLKRHRPASPSSSSSHLLSRM
eukprot:8231228-Pyramimonas_sp.AAC.1